MLLGLLRRFVPPAASWHPPSQNAISFCSAFVADLLVLSFFEKIKQQENFHKLPCSHQLTSFPCALSPFLFLRVNHLCSSPKAVPSLLPTFLLSPAQIPDSCKMPRPPRHQFFPLYQIVASSVKPLVAPNLQQSPFIPWLLPPGVSFSKLPLGIVYANGLHFDPECIQSFTPPGFFTQITGLKPLCNIISEFHATASNNLLTSLPFPPLCFPCSTLNPSIRVKSCHTFAQNVFRASQYTKSL